MSTRSAIANNSVELKDPKRMLEGTGKGMRHVKVSNVRDIDSQALKQLITGKARRRE